MKTFLTFTSHDFNTTEVNPNFINPCCFGEDVASWLNVSLSAHGAQAGPMIQEDWGWTFSVLLQGVQFWLNVGLIEGDARWLIMCEPRLGLWARLRRSRHHEPALRALCRAVHLILSHDSRIHDLRWHEKETFDTLGEYQGAATSD